MSTEIIELMQSDSNTIGQSEYTVIVPPGTIINPGDMMSMEKCFLDTQAIGSQKIVVPEDILVDATVGYYMTCCRGDAMDLSGGGADVYAANVGLDTYVDTKTYVLMEENAAGGFELPGILFVSDQPYPNNGITLFSLGRTGGNPGDAFYYYGINLIVEYTDPLGNLKVKSVNCGDFTWALSEDNQQTNVIPSFVFDKTKPVLFKNALCNGERDDGSTVPLTNQQAQIFGGGTSMIFQFHVDKKIHKGVFSFNPPPGGAASPANGTTYPFLHDTEIQGTSVLVGKGSYSEADLAGVLNDGFQRDYSSSANPLYSSFLLNYNKTRYPNTVWVEEAKLAAFDTAANLSAYNGGLLIGATQMEMSYDQDRAKFLWKYAHSPFLYGPTGATEAVGFVLTNNLGDVAENGKAKIVTRNSGVFFTSLRARVKSNNQPFDLWRGLMGFNTDKILVQMENAANTTINNRVFPNLQMPISLAAGTFTTENYQSLAMMADPRNPGDQWWYMPDLTQTYMTTANDQTVPIFAAAQDSAQNENNEGYYLISVATKARGAYVGGDGYSSGSIIGVVGGFYSRDSYTAGTAGDAIGYIHNGPPLSLDSFKVRLLGPDKQPSRVLGDRNCVMLRITRGQPPPPPQ
jgi:hypothetical protein